MQGKITIGVGDVALRRQIFDLLDIGHSRILLNLVGVSYMDSAGIGELIACYKRVLEKGGSIKLLNPSGKVYDLSLRRQRVGVV